MSSILLLSLITSSCFATLSQLHLLPSGINVSESCQAAIQKLSALEAAEPTLMAQYWDSWGKPSSGILYGHTVFLGYYDECIDLKYTAVGETKYCIYAMEMNSTFMHDFKDKVCQAEDCPKPLNANASTTIEIGVCYPSACTPNEFAIVLSNMDISFSTSLTANPFDSVMNSHTTKLTSTSEAPAFCPKTDAEYDSGTTAVIAVFGVLFGLVALGTGLDFFSWLFSSDGTHDQDKEVTKKGIDKGKLDDKPHLMDFIKAYSLCNTVPSLLSTKQPPSVVKAVSAIKVLGILCNIVLHVFIVINFFYSRISQNTPHYILISKFSARMVNQPFVNITFAVDTFFVVSATLSSYLTFKDMEKHKRFRFWYFYITRYFRLAPMFYLATLFAYKLFVHLSQGSLWHYPEIGCPLTWWFNVFFINNIIHPGAVCLQQSWHVSAEMQLFALSPIFILALYHGGISGLIFLALSIAGCTSFIAYVAIRNGYVAAQLTQPMLKNLEQTQYLYCTSFYRMNPYLVGILLGYILYKKYSIADMPIAKSTKQFIYIILWLIALYFCSNTLFGTIGEYNGTHHFTDWENATFLMFGGLTWSIGLAIIIYICNTGYGGVVNTVLSWPGWDPLVRLSYGVYLFHVMVLYYIMGTMQTSFIFTDSVFIMLCVYLTVAAFSVSVVMTLIVDIPISKVVLLFFKLTGTERRSK